VSENEIVFDVQLSVFARVKINREVFTQVDAEWKRMFYKLDTDADIVSMIVSNLVQGIELSHLDGFANLPDSHAVWVNPPEYEVEEVEEVK